MQSIAKALRALVFVARGRKVLPCQNLHFLEKARIYLWQKILFLDELLAAGFSSRPVRQLLRLLLKRAPSRFFNKNVRRDPAIPL